MELGITGRASTIINRSERYCKSEMRFTLHVRFEELEIEFFICVPCLVRYIKALPFDELKGTVEALAGR